MREKLAPCSSVGVDRGKKKKKVRLRKNKEEDEAFHNFC